MGGEDEGNTIISFTDLTQILSTAPVLSFTEGGGALPLSAPSGAKSWSGCQLPSLIR